MPLSNKSEPTPFRWTLNIFLAIIIFGSAECSSLLGIKTLPLNLSPVWPATGFSLAALLIFGFRAWSGIFAGNFIYNFLHLYLNGTTFFGPLTVALSISLGSLLQALLGGYVIRRFSTPAFFDTVRDIIIFLIGGGLLTCTIAASIAVITFYLYGVLVPDQILFTWLTMWLGDSMGVYIITPLVVRWLLRKSPVPITEHRLEAFFMVIGYGILSLLFISVQRYPAIYFFLLLSIWITCRFRIHGATTAIFFISLTTIIATELGYGSFLLSYPVSPFLALVAFLQLLVIVNLILAAVMNERDVLWNLVQAREIAIAEAVRVHIDEMKEMRGEILLKEKLSAHSTLTSVMASRLHAYLKKIRHNTQAGMEILNQILLLTTPQRDTRFDSYCRDIEQHLQGIQTLETQATCLTSHMALSTPEKIKIRSIDLNQLLDNCIIQCMRDLAEMHPDFSYSVVKKLSKTIEMTLALPEDLGRAIIFYLNHALISMKEKRDKLGVAYDAELEVHTFDHGEKVEIVIKNNGMVVSEPDVNFFFQSLTKTPAAEEVIDLNSSLAHDIIVFLHGGELNISVEKGECLQVSITIPKTQK